MILLQLKRSGRLGGIKATRGPEHWVLFVGNTANKNIIPFETIFQLVQCSCTPRIDEYRTYLVYCLDLDSNTEYVVIMPLSE